MDGFKTSRFIIKSQHSAFSLTFVPFFLLSFLAKNESKSAILSNCDTPETRSRINNLKTLFVNLFWRFFGSFYSFTLIGCVQNQFFLFLIMLGNQGLTIDWAENTLVGPGMVLYWNNLDPLHPSLKSRKNEAFKCGLFNTNILEWRSH